MSGCDLGAAVAQAGQAQFGRRAIGNVGEVLDILIQRALLIVDGGHAAVRRMPRNLVGQFRPGILAVIDRDDVLEVDVPLQSQDLLLRHLGNTLHIGHGKTAARIFAIYPEFQSIGIVDIEQEGVIAPGGVRAVFCLHGDGIDLPVAGGVTVVCGETVDR